MRRKTQRNAQGKNLSTFNKTQQLAKSWNPLPERKHFGKGGKVRETIETRSNFVNCAQSIFNVGKYKGIEVKDVPAYYLTWVLNNIQLNPAEITLLKRYIKLKQK